MAIARSTTTAAMQIPTTAPAGNFLDVDD